MKHPLLGVMFVGVAALYGCTTTQQQATAPAADKPADTTAQSGAGTAPATGSAAGTGTTAAAQDAAEFVKVFYFPYDSEKISAADQARLEANARFLARNPKVSVRIEGNADERGTREYNLALGDRRARAVQRLLLAKGVAAGNTSPISNGKERPVATCHEESCWRLNRRVELVLSGS